MNHRGVNIQARFLRGNYLLWLLLFFAAVLSSSPGATQEGLIAPDLLGSEGSDCLFLNRSEVHLPLPVPGDTLELPHRLISEKGFCVRAGDHLFEFGSDYRLEPGSGRIIWLAEKPDTAPLIVSCRWLPLPLTGDWHGRLATAPSETLLVTPGRAATRRALPAGANLRVGGSKTFSLEFGNRRDVNLSQSLDLSIKGNLARDVTVQAILTDRNLPLQPEGTTSELADLDQVLIEINSPWGELHLGDLVVRERDFQFSAFQRELEGIQLKTSHDYQARANATVGRGVGKHHSVEFIGEQGKQGPYQLVSRLPGEEKLMVAGSERVWLDNQRLSRGEEADYTVDYSRGEIWFTSRHPISAVSEIRVDFQVREGAYERGFTSIGSALADSSRFVSATWFRELDDTDRSPTIDLDEKEREALAAAGDSTTSALEGGITWLGAALGPYEMVEVDTVETPIFVYLGTDPISGNYLGSYEVVFTFVGEDKGDYADSLLLSGEKIYSFIGPNRGDYQPGRRLQLPEALDLFAVRAGGDLGGGVFLSTEGAFSLYDRNILSSRDDNDNNGTALAIDGKWLSGKRIGRRRDILELRFQLREVNKRFMSPEPLDGAFYYKRWNTSAADLTGDQRRAKGGLTFRPWRSFLLDGDWESLRSGEEFSGERIHTRLERTGRIYALAEGWLGSTRSAGIPGQEERGRVALAWRSRWNLQTEYRFEDLKRGESGEENGNAYRIVDLKLGSGTILPGISAVTTTQMRWNYTHSLGQRQRVSGLRKYQTEIDMTYGQALAHLIYTHTVSIDENGSSRNRTNLADWDISYKRPQKVFRGEWRGKLTMEESALRSEKVIYIGSDAGHYDSTGRYIGIGDYELYFSQADSSEMETRLESICRIGGKPLWWVSSEKGILRGVEASVYGKVTVSTPEDAQSLFANPTRIWKGADPVRGHTGLLRWEFSWKGARGLPKPRLSIDQRRSTKRSYTGFARIRKSLRQNLDLRWVIRSGLQGRFEIEQTREKQGVIQPSVSEGAFDDLLRRRMAIEGRWRFYGPLAGRMGAEAGNSTLSPTGTRESFYEALAGASADFRKQGRLELVWERRWSDISSGGGGAFVLDQPGWKLTATGSLRPKPGFTTSINVRLEKKEGQEQIITGRMDAKAFF